MLGLSSTEALFFINWRTYLSDNIFDQFEEHTDSTDKLLTTSGGVRVGLSSPSRCESRLEGQNKQSRE